MFSHGNEAVPGGAHNAGEKILRCLEVHNSFKDI